MATKKGTAKTQQKTQEKQQPKAQETSMEVKINRVFHDEKSNLKALASVNIDNKFAVHGIRVVDSSKGLFVSMPSTSYTDRNGETQYSDIFHPITAEARDELIEKVKSAYDQALEESQKEGQEEGQDENPFEEGEEEQPDFVPTM